MNKVHKIIWSAALNTWVVASELAKGKQKSSSTQRTNAPTNNHKAKHNALWATLVLLGLASSTGAYAGSCSVGTATELTKKLNDASCDTIELTANINLASMQLTFGGRESITIDGKGFTLNTGGSRIEIWGTQTNSMGGNLALNFVNFSAITSSTALANPIVWVQGLNSKVDVLFDDIGTMPSNMYVAMASGIGNLPNVQNKYSQLIIGNVTNPTTIKLDTNKQLAQASNIKFTGQYKLNSEGNGSYPFVFWSYSPIEQNKVEFASTADVEIKLKLNDNFTTGGGGATTGNGYRYIFADGARFLLWGKQNVFGDATVNNTGIQIGTYDKATQSWGAGSVIRVAGVENGTLVGDGLSNAAGKVGGIDNGPGGAEDVIFNLAAGSSFNATGKGISVVKNSGNTSGIYVRSATDITAATGIQIEHNGTGEVVLANQGTITSTATGIQLLSTSNNTMALDSTGGVINATSGTGIKVGTGAANGNVNLNLTGGEINLAGSATGIEFNGTTTNTHSITGTTINVNGTGTAIKNNANDAITLKDTKVNVIDTVGFSSLTGITFAKGDNGERNAVTVTGSGTGVTVAKDLADLSSAYLDINVTSATGTGVEITGGTFVDTITVDKNLNINAIGATAIKVSGTGARDFINKGTVKGNIVFANGAVDNKITNIGTINGTLTTGGGNDTLILAEGSNSQGAIDLGDGANNVTINNGAKIASIVTGAGNDTFNLIRADSSTDLGVLDAGIGVNQLNITNSKIGLGVFTELKNFQTVSLAAASELVLVNTKNIASGTIDIAADSQLTFATIYNGNLTAALTGTGTALVKNDAKVSLTKTSTFAGTWDVNQGGALTATSYGQLGTADIDLAGTLNFNGALTTNNKLTGAGLITVDHGSALFSFGADVGNAFIGTVDLKRSSFNLMTTNTTALTNATLKLSTGSNTSVSFINQAIGNLDLNGGKITFGATGSIATNNLTVSSDSGVITGGASHILSNTNLLDQDNGSGAQLRLVSSNNTLSDTDLAKLTFQDTSGSVIPGNNAKITIQNGAAIATHNHSFLGDKGLSVGSLLTQLDIQTGKTLTLTSAGATDTTLTAKLTGAGALAIGTDNVSTTINNNQNDYKGATTVNAGTLILGSNKALGDTSLLDVKNGATANINGKTQTVGALDNAGNVSLGSAAGALTSTGAVGNTYGGVIGLAGGTLTSAGVLINYGNIGLAGGTLTVEKLNNHAGAIDLAGGTLNLTSGLSYSNGAKSLIGAGTLNVKGGDFMIKAANSGLSAATNIANGASVTLTSTGALGTSAVAITGDLNLNIADADFANILSGTGSVNTNKAVTLTGDNKGFTGTQAIKTGGELTIGKAANLGADSAKVNLENASSKLIFNAVSETIANVLTGVTDSIIEIANGSGMSLTGDNSSFAGKYDINGNSILSVSKDNNLGTSNVAIGSGSQLVLSALEGGVLTALDNTLTGTGTLALSGSNLNIVDTKANAFTGTFDIKDSSALNVSSDTQLNTGATINVAAASDKFNIASSGAFNLNNKLTGEGVLNVDTTNNAFSFGTNVDSDFAGTVDLKNSTFDLSGDNTAALTGATLKVSSGNVTTVANSNQIIGNLDLNGGTTVFVKDSLITTTELKVSEDSIVKVDTANVSNSGNLLDQDNDSGALTKLVTSNNTLTTGELTKITLQDTSGVALGGGAISDVKQGGETVAEATHNHKLSGDNGLSVGSLLTQLDIKTGKTLTLTSYGATDTTLTAKLTGVGNLEIGADNVSTTINNANNTYTGTTTVNAGTLILGSNKALGDTSLLDVKNGATANINGKTQTVGALTNAGTVSLGSTAGALTSTGALSNTGILGLAGGSLTAQGAFTNTGTVDLASGTLNLSAGGTSSSVGGLTGAGTLNVDGGDFMISAANSGLTADTNIKNGASVSLTSTGALGTSAVAITGDLNLNIADADFANILSGTGSVNTNVAVTLTGANTGFTGTQAIKAGGELTVGNAANLGADSATVNLEAASSKLIFYAVTDAVANVLTGVTDSIIEIANGSNMSLTADNSGFAGKYDINDNGSILTVTKDHNLGTSNVAIGSDSQLVLSALEGGVLTALDNTLTGAGTLALSGSKLNIVDTKASGFTGTFNIKDTSALNVSSDTQLNNSATINVAAASDQFNIASTAVFNLNNKLTGQGLVNVDTTNNAFSFGTKAGNAFAGTVDLKNSTFSLSGDNTTALTGATLKVSTGNVTTVGTKGNVTTEHINALDINGGTLIFNGGVPNTKTESTIAVDNLTLNSGKVEVNGDATGWSNPGPSGSLSILDQNRGDIKLELISSVNTVSGDVDNINLHINGDKISSGTQASYSDILQGIDKVAIGTYNYGLTSKNNDGKGGLYVNYGLTELNLLVDGANALLIATAADSASNKNLTAKLTGVGGLVVDASLNNLTISNANNDYTGGTTVNAGTLILGSNKALGDTFTLYVKSDATANINGNTQTVGSLNNWGTVSLGSTEGNLTSTNTLGNYGTIDLAGGTLTTKRLDNNHGAIDLAGGTLTSQILYNFGAIDLAAGVLNLSDSGTSSSVGGLTGAGTLNVDGGDFMINAANSGLSANTNIAGGASVTLNSAGALGTSAVAITGDLNLNAADTLTNTLSGTGSVNTNKAVTLTGDNKGFTGTQAIKTGGTLTVSSASNLGADSATANLEDASSKLIFDAVTGAIANALTGVTGSTVQITSSSGMSLTADNSGFAGKYDINGSGSILTVTKNYNLGTSNVAIGSGSQLVLNALEGGVLTALDNTLTGAGTLALSGSKLNIVDTKASGFTGTFNIKDTSALNVSSDAYLSNDATINVAAASDQFNIASTAVFNLNSKLTGQGLVNVDTTNNAFSFGTKAGNAFAGTVDLKNSTFSLSGDNTTALMGATLKLSAGNSTTVGLGEQNIGSLVINGGTLYFNDITENAGVITSGGTIKANTIDASGTGDIRVDLPTGMTPGLDGYTVMQLDEGAVVVDLAKGATTGSGNLLTLSDKNGNPIGADIQQGIKNAGSSTDAATGTFNYGLTTGNSKDGLYVSYGLKQVELLATGSDALKLTTNVAQTGTAASDLSAKVTGAGDLAIEADTGATASLSNSTNDYRGTTFVRSGSLRLDADSALGQTSLLDVASSATANINGKTQTVGALTNAGTVSLGSTAGALTSTGAVSNTGILGLAGGTVTAQGAFTNTGTVDLASGALNLSAGGTSSSVGGLTGAGTLNVNGGNLTISAANSGLSAATSIANGAQVSLTSTGALGTSAVAITGDLNLNVDDTNFANILSGTGNVNTNNAVTLTGTNTGFTGTQAIKTGGELTIGKAANLGADSAKVNLENASSKLIFNAATDAVANVLTGVADSIVQITTGSDMSLTADNSGFAGKYDINGNSILTVTKDHNLGTSNVAIGSGSQLVLNALEGGLLTALDNTLTGTGTLALSGSKLNIVDTKANAFTGTFNIKDSSALNVSSDAQLSNDATINVAAASDQFNIASTAAFNLNNKLTGQGLVNVDTTNNAFSFGTKAGNAFAGTVDLKNSTFNLSGNNTTALTGATLKVSTGNVTTVGTKGNVTTEHINALDINGGTLIFNGGVPNTKAESTIAVDNLTLNSGKVEVNGDTTGWSNPGPSGSLSILDQNRGDIKLELITSSNAASGAGNIDLYINGTQISSGTPAADYDILQGIDKVATGTYNYGLTSTNNSGNNGLYVNYGLTELDLLADGAKALIIATDADSASNKELTAKLTGNGGLMIDASLNDLTISNANNTYTGTTTINAGTLILGSNNALGQTSLLDVASGATANINGKTQTVGKLQSTLGSTLDLNSGQLTIKSGGLVNGALIGAGDLIVNADTLTINGANANLTAQVKIDAPATIALNDVAGLGSSDIALAGILALDNASGDLGNSISGTGNLTLNNASNVNLMQDSANFAGKIAIDNASSLTATAVAQLGTASITNDGTLTFNLNIQDEALKSTVVGSGDFIKNGTKRLSLTQSLGYTGKTMINEGSLFVGDNLTLGGIGAGDVTIASGADLSGSGFVNGRVINYGSINVNSDPTRRALDSATLTINNSLDNHNTINIGNQSGTVGNSLVVNGDYTGFGNARLYMSTALGSDMTSLVDQFIVAGHAGGSTSVYVNNVGGVGASTSELGVRLIDVGTSDPTAFSLANTVVSGAYEYLLNRNQANQDWYLSSYVAPDPVQLYRPDLGNHIANMESAVKSQVPGLGGQSSGVMAGGSGGMRAMNRLGNHWGGEKTDSQKLYSIWNVTTGGDSKGRAANGQISYKHDSIGTLLGGDRSIFVGRSLIQLGAMVGTSKSDSSSRNLITGSRGTGEVDGTTFGLYGTWYLDANSALSPFIDAFITYGRYKNEVKTWGNTPTKYNSKALSVTLQGGYPIALGSNVVLEPQAQITYLNYKAKDHFDHGGTLVSQKLSGNVIGRVGTYVYLTDMPVKPYAALNLWYDNTRSTVKYNDHKVSSDKAGFMLEAKVGVEAQLSPNFSISGGVNYRQGNHSSKNYSGNIGFKYTF